MPLPRSKDEGSSGAPVMNLLRAHVRLTDVQEKAEPFAVTRKSDGATFELDPQFKCTIEILDDGEDGELNGTRFFESFKYKLSRDGQWVNKENSKLGQLTNVVKPGYFADDSIPELTEEDLEGFEMVCQIKPKKNPTTGQVLGSTIDWETMKPLRKKPASAQATAEEDDLAGIFDDIAH